MGETEEFNTLAFEKRLMQLKDTQDSIQSLSSWCLKQRSHHKKIVSSWLNVLKRVKVEQRLVLFYLANDVIQYSKRKNYEFVESWGLNLQKATPLVRDEKVRQKILRIFKIWEQRSVYDEEFLSDLTGLLSAGAVKKTDDEVIDFQPQQLVNKIKQCSVLEADTDQRLKYIHDSHLNLSDTDSLCANLKEKYIHSTDKRSKDDIEKDLNEGIHCVEKYTQALQREIVAREALLALLSSANQYYSTQRGEVKVVAYAYKNFGARVRTLKRKLDELIPTLPNADPSPPQRDEDVPSPGPDEDLELPTTNDNEDVTYNIDKTFNSSIGADGSLYNLGLSSFLTSDNPMALFNESNNSNNSANNKIEVINTRPNENQDFNINDFLKTLIPNDSNTNSTNNLVTSTTKQDSLPGLDLLTPESTGNPPPSSFYGASVDRVNEEPEPYTPEAYTPEPYIPQDSEQSVNSPWTNSSWMPLRSVPPPPPVPPPALLRDTPESPPPPPVPQIAVPPPILPTTPYTNTSVPPPTDVDHRGMIPPPPPPPILPPLLSSIEDVDHRLLPTLPPPPVPPPIRHQSQDVDHRNLISLTHQPATNETVNNTNSVDQDYRVPPVLPPPDIVESVDMDLSEDEDPQSIYPNQNPAENRRNSYNNNKVLVGGDPNMNDGKGSNLSRANSAPEEFQIPPAPPLMSISFEDLQDDVNEDSINDGDYKYEEEYPEYQKDNFQNEEYQEESQDNTFDEDLRSRSLDTIDELDSEWRNRPQPGMNLNHRFPRNWTPRTNRPFAPQNHFWPRNGPRTPNRWMGPRPQRFW